MIVPNDKFLIVKQYLPHFLNKSVFRNNNNNNSCISQESLRYAAIKYKEKNLR